MRSIAFALSPLLVLFAAACDDPGPWEDRETSFAVWSDDGSEIAVVTTSYQQRCTICEGAATSYEERDASHQLLLTDRADLDARQPLGEAFAGYASSIYDMRAAGYVVVEGRVIDRVSGAPRELDLAAAFSSAEGLDLEAVPSPDGAVLAAVATRDYLTDVETNTLALFDPVSGRATSVPLALPGGADRFVQMKWTGEGTLVVQTIERWLLVMPDGELRAIPERDATCPDTSSSEINADGERVSADPMTGELTIQADADARPWGDCI